MHPSNFRIVGFSERPRLEELVALAGETGLPLVEDLGSGCLFDFATLGLSGETPVKSSLAAGVDVVTFSGDKLLGGPQAGVIAGREDLIGRIRRNPLFRALRADKLVYAALEATLRDYVLERWDQIPVLRMARQTAAELRQRAERFVAALGGDFAARVELVAGESVLGGGSTPGQGLPTTLIAVATGRRSNRRADRGAPARGRSSRWSRGWKVTGAAARPAHGFSRRAGRGVAAGAASGGFWLERGRGRCPSCGSGSCRRRC